MCVCVCHDLLRAEQHGEADTIYRTPTRQNKFSFGQMKQKHFSLPRMCFKIKSHARSFVATKQNITFVYCIFPATYTILYVFKQRINYSNVVLQIVFEACTYNLVIVTSAAVALFSTFSIERCRSDEADAHHINWVHVRAIDQSEFISFTSFPFRQTAGSARRQLHAPAYS